MRLKISLPSYSKDKWDYLEVTGHVELEGNADNLSEGYDQLKVQVEALLRLLTVGAIGLTEATNRPTQGFLPGCPSQSRQNFLHKRQVNSKLTRHPETIPKLSRNNFTASPLAAAPSQPDHHREVMQCPKRHYLREGLDNFSPQNQTPRSSFFKALRRSLLLY